MMGYYYFVAPLLISSFTSNLLQLFDSPLCPGITPDDPKCKLNDSPVRREFGDNYFDEALFETFLLTGSALLHHNTSICE